MLINIYFNNRLYSNISREEALKRAIPADVIDDAFNQYYWVQIRIKRNQLLSGSDWSQLPDAPLSNENRQAWAAYRQALRELPQKVSNPQTLTWPTVPTIESS